MSYIGDMVTVADTEETASRKKQKATSRAPHAVIRNGMVMATGSDKKAMSAELAYQQRMFPEQASIMRGGQ